MYTCHCTKMYSVQKFHENELHQDLPPISIPVPASFHLRKPIFIPNMLSENSTLEAFQIWLCSPPHPRMCRYKESWEFPEWLPEPHYANMQTPLRFVSRTGLCRKISWSSSVLADLSRKLRNWCIWLIQFFEKGYYRDGVGGVHIWKEPYINQTFCTVI